MRTTHDLSAAAIAWAAGETTDDAEAVAAELAGATAVELDAAIADCLGWKADLGVRQRAIQLLVDVRYDNPPPPG